MSDFDSWWESPPLYLNAKDLCKKAWSHQEVQIEKLEARMENLREALKNIASVRDRNCWKDNQCTCAFDTAIFALKKDEEMR